jgi:hypothetical protein
MKIDELKISVYKEIILKDYIHNLVQWKDGRLATLNEKSCFSIVEITKEDKANIIPISKFPKKPIDGYITAFPEVNVIHASVYGAVHFFSDLDTKKNIQIIPIKSPQLYGTRIFLINKERKIFLLTYSSWDGTYSKSDYVIYDLLNDKVLYNPMNESMKAFNKNIIKFVLDDNFLICEKFGAVRNAHGGESICLFDIEKNKYVENILTNLLSSKFIYNLISIKNENKLIINWGREVNNKTEIENIIVSWKDDFKDIALLPIFSPLIDLRGKEFYFTNISYDNKWLCGYIYSYATPFAKMLKKYCYINIDSNSPYYLIPVVSEEYYSTSPHGEFINHSIHGTCFIEPIEKSDGNKYLCIYKMSDVEKVIQEYLLKKTKEIEK